MEDEFSKIKKAIAQKQKYQKQSDQYSFIDDVSDGLLRFQEMNQGLYGYLNIEMEIVIKAIYVDAKPFASQLAVVAQMLINNELDDDLGVNKTIWSKLLGVLNVKDSDKKKQPASKELKYGFINIKEETVIDFLFDEAYSFSEGWAVVCLKQKWLLIDSRYEQKIFLDIDRVLFPFTLENGQLPVLENGKKTIVKLDSLINSNFSKS